MVYCILSKTVDQLEGIKLVQWAETLLCSNGIHLECIGFGSVRSAG